MKKFFAALVLMCVLVVSATSSAEVTPTSGCIGVEPYCPFPSVAMCVCTAYGCGWRCVR